MKQFRGSIDIATSGPGLTDITRDVARSLAQAGIAEGLVTLFVQHTSASLLIQENADPDVLADLNNFFARLVSRDPKLYRHRTEGPDDMPAHIRAALTQSSLSIPLEQGALMLGTWQGIYLFEHRDSPHRRRVIVHALGE